MIIPKFTQPIQKTSLKFIGTNPKVRRAQDIQKLLNNDWKVKDIAEALGTPQSLITQAMRQYGLKRPK